MSSREGLHRVAERDEANCTGAVLLMSMPARTQAGPVAVWITAAGWASAAQQALGQAWLVTPAGLLEPEEARAIASAPTVKDRSARSGLRWLPATLKTLLKDVRSAKDAYSLMSMGMNGPWERCDVRFVWQRHDLFQTAGLRAARRHGCPLVLFVDAPVVWEAKRWGVKRPGWGWLLEAIAEKPVLRKADLVACVSEEVADQVQRLGVPPERVMVTPCSVDTAMFHPLVDGSTVRERYGLNDKFVVGWTGSFRRFHGLEVLLDAFGRLQDEVSEAFLLLVGDGSERQRLAELAVRRDLVNKVVFTGTVPHDEIPIHVAAMDVAVLTAPKDAAFHYSPLKLKEYMACGRAVVAPRAGSIPSSLIHAREGLLVEPGDHEALAAALATLHASSQLRHSLGKAAHERIREEGMWEHQVKRVLERHPVLGKS